MNRHRGTAVLGCVAVALALAIGATPVVQAARGAGGGMVTAVSPTGGTCFYRPNQVIAASGQSAQMQNVLGVPVRERTSLIPDKLQGIYPSSVTRLSLYAVSGVDPLQASIALNNAGVSAAPNYLSNFAPGVRTWAPGEDAVPVPGPFPLVGGASAGAGSRIGVLDTGFDRSMLKAISSKAPLTYVPAQSIATELSSRGLIEPGYIQPLELASGRAAGHGTFITGLIRRTAPGASILVAQAPFFNADDATFNVEASPLFVDAKSSRADDASLTYMMYSAFVSGTGLLKIDVLSLSFGSYGCSTEFESNAGEGDFRTPIGLRNGLLAMSRWSGGRLLVVAAAGNDSTEDRFYPAAFAANRCFDPATQPSGPAGSLLKCSDASKVVSPWLAATRSTPSRLGSYSNYGVWTNLEAQGSDVYSVRLGAAWASWSGTSFAAPCAATMATLKGISDWADLSGGLIDCSLG